jgi:hypothetical protein
MNSGKNSTPGTLYMIYVMDKVSATTLVSQITESSLNETGRCATQLFSESGLQDPDFVYGAQVNWGYRMDTISQWDDVATWSIEMFGLPGERYITEINVNDMTWWFRSEQDRLVFVLRNGQARCIQLELST